MNKWKLAFFTCFALLVISNSFLALRLNDLIDSYREMGGYYANETKSNEILKNLIIKNDSKYSRQEFIDLLKQSNPDIRFVEEGNKIVLGQVTFEFLNGFLYKIN